MKLFVFSLFFLFFVQNSKAQEGFSVTTSSSKELFKSKENGVFEFILPNEIKKDNVKNAAQYYTTFFTVNFDESTHNATISMIENNASNRRVILRFFAMNKISKVTVEGNSLTVQEFYEKYLN
jgi:hypothetical protein